jgi:hypothetical protein
LNKIYHSTSKINKEEDTKEAKTKWIVGKIQLLQSGNHLRVETTQKL